MEERGAYEDSETDYGLPQSRPCEGVETGQAVSAQPGAAGVWWRASARKLGNRNAPPLPDPRRDGLREDGDLYGAHRRTSLQRRRTGHRSDSGDRPDLPDGDAVLPAVWGADFRFEFQAVPGRALSISTSGPRKGLIDVMIGPRSALFAPFPNLGDHHSWMRSTRRLTESETVPRYLAREAAVQRGDAWKGPMWSWEAATPSVDAYYEGGKRSCTASFTIRRAGAETAALPDGCHR